MTDINQDLSSHLVCMFLAFFSKLFFEVILTLVIKYSGRH